MGLSNYKEALAHFYNIDMLNEKGLREYIKHLSIEPSQDKLKIMDLERDLQYKKPKHL